LSARTRRRAVHSIAAISACSLAVIIHIQTDARKWSVLRRIDSGDGIPWIALLSSLVMVSASGRSAISRYMSRKLLAVDRRFISLHSSRYWGKNVAIFPLCIAKIVVETESLHFVTVYRTLSEVY